MLGFPEEKVFSRRFALVVILVAISSATLAYHTQSLDPEEEKKIDVSQKDITISDNTSSHIVGLNSSGDIEKVRKMTGNVRSTIDFGEEIGAAVVGPFTRVELKKLAKKDYVRYIEPNREVSSHSLS